MASTPATIFATFPISIPLCTSSMKICNEPYDYNLVFNKNKGDALLKGYEVFEPYGWYFEDEEERQVLDGTSELYRKEKKK